MPKPDSALVSKFLVSPNHDVRAGGEIDMIVLHYTGMNSADAARERLCDPAARVSSHYLVDEDGVVVQLVPEAGRAWHAGISYWAGETDINSRSIGIEIVNGGHDFGLPEFPSSQIDAVIGLCRDLQARWPIPPSRVLAHSDVAPSRKCDPGEKFPWRVLSDAGIGLWVEPHPGIDESPSQPGDRGDEILRLKKLFADYGYGTDDTDVYNDVMRDVVAAFQRHFRPSRVDGIADSPTINTLRDLLVKLRGTVR